jgi:hypothetical protein
VTTLIIVLVLVSVTIPAALAFVHWRLQKRDRIQLRLHRGRSRLLGEEIEQRAAELIRYDDEMLAPARFDADRALDELHVAMMDRHAHVLNSQDLAHLQRHKIAIQEHALSQLLAREMTDAVVDDDTAAQSPSAVEEPRRDRQDRIDGLLDKIAESSAKAKPKGGRRSR